MFETGHWQRMTRLGLLRLSDGYWIFRTGTNRPPSRGLTRRLDSLKVRNALLDLAHWGGRTPWSVPPFIVSTIFMIQATSRPSSTLSWHSQRIRSKTTKCRITLIDSGGRSPATGERNGRTRLLQLFRRFEEVGEPDDGDLRRKFVRRCNRFQTTGTLSVATSLSDDLSPGETLITCTTQ